LQVKLREEVTGGGHRREGGEGHQGHQGHLGSAHRALSLERATTMSASLSRMT
jgi:hypothetical protein